jgi:hypothetical protein
MPNRITLRTLTNGILRPLRAAKCPPVNWLTRTGAAAKYDAHVKSAKSESRDFAFALITTTVLALGLVAYARWSTPAAEAPGDVSSQGQLPHLGAARSSRDPPRPGKSAVIATVFECETADHQVFSDRPCSENAQLREVNAPNGMRPTRIAASRATMSRSVAERPIPASDNAEPSARSKHSLCKSIDDQIDRINARMRQSYSASEGEWFRENLRRLDDERWDAKCRIH